MISYRIPSNQFNQSQEHRLMNLVHIKKEPIDAKSEFNPLEMLDIFEHGRQIKVIERTANPYITQYLDTAAPKLAKGFNYVMHAGQVISAKLLKDNVLPNQTGREAFLLDIDHLSDLYFNLMGCPQIGLRIEVLNSAMCPKFHVDKTGIRMLCTYQGQGTQWLEDIYADRSKLGMASAHLDDSNSGLILNPQGVHTAPRFAIALLKGSLWQGNHMAGVIHRSPAFLDSSPRVLLALDALW